MKGRAARGQFVVAAAVLAGLAGCAGPAARLEGRVVFGGSPLSNAIVTLESDSGSPPLEVVTDAAGVYRFPPLAPGAYRLRARGHSGSYRLGAVPGKNPLQLAAGNPTWLGLQAVPWEEPETHPQTGLPFGFGSLSGTARFSGHPVDGVVVSLYLDPTGGLRGPGMRQSFPTGPDGAYALDEVPEGAYYVVARKRQGGAAHGPVREGDLYGAALANPVPVRSGKETRLDIHLIRKERDDDPSAELLARSRTGLRGRVVDSDGHPAGGVYVFAYRNRVVGHGMPDFFTLPTGPDGKFSLPLGSGGLFYVGARERTGGSPTPGEWFGFYEGSPDHGIAVAPGRIIEGIEIVVRRVLEP